MSLLLFMLHMLSSIDVVDILRLEEDDTLYMLVPLLLFCGFGFDAAVLLLLVLVLVAPFLVDLF